MEHTAHPSGAVAGTTWEEHSDFPRGQSQKQTKLRDASTGNSRNFYAGRPVLDAKFDSLFLVFW